jgi:hypothetical protein
VILPPLVFLGFSLISFVVKCILLAGEVLKSTTPTHTCSMKDFKPSLKFVEKA